jgi:hypothetical protein
MKAFTDLVVLDPGLGKRPLEDFRSRSSPPAMFVINPSPRPTYLGASNRIASGSGSSPQFWA